MILEKIEMTLDIVRDFMGSGKVLLIDVLQLI